MISRRGLIVMPQLKLGIPDRSQGLQGLRVGGVDLAGQSKRALEVVLHHAGGAEIGLGDLIIGLHLKRLTKGGVSFDVRAGITRFTAFAHERLTEKIETE